ncbi:MAG: preprotein translocase subunit SecE [bacterium]
MSKIANYLTAAVQEMKKVSWPTKKETYHYTVLVIVISVVIAAFLGGLDYLFNALLQVLLNK